MGYVSKEGYFKKQLYAERKMDEQKFNTNLSEEQHEIIADLCSIRHKFHTMDARKLFNTNSTAFTELSELFGFDKAGDLEENSIYNRLKSLDLPELPILDIYELPDDMLWDLELTDEERYEWEKKAEKYNSENPNGIFKHTGYSLWEEESGYISKLWDMLEDYNNIIERYLKAIDEKYGTNYCPTGSTRLF